MGEGTLLIDCHSFSSKPNLLNSNPPDIDICIGYNDDDTCPNKVVIGNIVHYFESLGYKVGMNEPFSNSKTFSVPIKYHSAMIEVNKRLYMDELTLEKNRRIQQTSTRNKITLWYLIKAIEEIYVTNKKKYKGCKRKDFCSDSIASK